MNPPCVIEQASLADLPRLVELLSAEADSLSASTLTEGVKAALEQPDLGHIFVVREQGRILAMATLVTTISTAEGGWVAILDDFTVEPARRNQGIGSHLLEAIRDYAAGQNLSRITIMPEGLNHSTRRFFQKRGFAGSEMIAMQLPLARPQAI